MMNYREELKSGIFRITFIKKDGSERVLIGTADPSLLPAQTDLEEFTSRSDRVKSDYIVVVYDLEAKGWRSFRSDSVISFEKIEFKVS